MTNTLYFWYCRLKVMILEINFIIIIIIITDFDQNVFDWSTVFDLIGARGAYVNLFYTTSAKRSS